MPEINLVQAVNLALARAMAEDADVLVLGEDVAAEGGVFRATDGLLTRFGPDRVLDTPLAENAIAGLSAGMSNDLETAVKHGSTCVRVGTALLGRRPLRSP